MRTVALAPSSSPPSARARWAVRWMAMSFVVWSSVLLLDLSSYFVTRAVSPEWAGPIPVAVVVLLHAVMWYSWWFWTPAVFYLAHRFSFEPGTRLRSLAAHAVTALAMIRLNAGVDAQLRGAFALSPSIHVSMGSLVQYAAICALAMILDLRRRDHAHLQSRALLESRLAQARVQALSAQLRPHFLFNALNGVAMLIRAGAGDKALESVVGYGELLRRTLDTDATEVPLREELAFLDRYLAIERMRFADSLSATISSEPGLGDALVPNFVLQPLVENALRHGLSNVETNARLAVVASRRQDVLRVEVRDNGAGLPEAWRLDRLSGVGLRSTQSRLRECYGDAHRFEVHSPLEGGTAVIIEIPFRVAAPAAAAGTA